MTDSISIQSDYVATTACNDDFAPFRAEDQTEQLLHNRPSVPSPVSPYETPIQRLSARPSNTRQDASVSPASFGLERDVAVALPQPLANEPSPPSLVFSPEALVRRRSVGPPNATQVETIELAQFRSESNTVTQMSSETTQRIHWLSPSLMTGAFIASIFLAIGHHLYYQSLNGQVVGSSQRQQWPLRFGNVFASLVKTFLTTAVSIACIQWLWKTLQRKYVTIEGIDAAFAVQESMLSFLSWEMLAKVKIGTLMALVLWSMPLIVLITPATLTVEISYKEITTSEKVATLDISTFLQHAPYTNNASALQFIERFSQLSSLVNNDDDDFTPEGPSNYLARIISASAASGDIASIVKPFQGTNMTYQTEFFLPSIKCETSSPRMALATTMAAVNASVKAFNSMMSLRMPEVEMNNTDMSNLDMHSLEYRDRGGEHTSLRIGYFATVSDDDCSSTREEFAPKTVLWIAIADHGTDNDTIPQFLNCKLWNASLSLNVSFLGNVQFLRPENYTFVNEVHPREDAYPPGQVVNLADLAYTAFFMGISQQLTGFVLKYRSYVLNQAKIQDTTLTGAPEFVAMMRNFSETNAGNFLPASPSLNKSLSALIQELSLNVSLNMLTDSVLSSLSSANVTHTILLNTYVYEPKYLVIAYMLAILFASVCVALGALAYCSNGVSYDSTVSSIIGTTQNPDLANLFRPQTLGAQPLDPQIAKTKLRFGTVTSLLSESSNTKLVRHAAFGLEGTVSELEKS